MVIMKTLEIKGKSSRCLPTIHRSVLCYFQETSNTTCFKILYISVPTKTSLTYKLEHNTVKSFISVGMKFRGLTMTDIVVDT